MEYMRYMEYMVYMKHMEYMDYMKYQQLNEIRGQIHKKFQGSGIVFMLLDVSKSPIKSC